MYAGVMRRGAGLSFLASMPYPTLPRFLVALTLASVVSLGDSPAQGYDTAVGLRVGAGFGMSATQRIGRRHSLEAIGQNRFGTDAFTLTLIGRRHFNLGIKRVNFFLGAGLHKGWGYVEEGERGDPLGITAQAGAEVTLGRTSITFDFLPQVHLSGRVVPASFGSAVGLRYVLLRRKHSLSIRRPWESEAEQRQRQREREKRRKARAKAKRRGERPSLRERLGLGPGNGDGGR